MASFARRLTHLAQNTARTRLSTSTLNHVATPSSYVPQRAFHALRPSAVLMKAKKGKGVVELLDEDDPELREAERLSKQEEEFTRKVLKEEAKRAKNANTAFGPLYETLLKETSNPKELHTMPKSSRLNNLLRQVKTAEDAEKLTTILEQWRNKRAPVNEHTSAQLIDACCRTGRPDIAYTLLGERQRYGLHPRVVDFEKTISTLCSVGDLDKAFITLAMVSAYNKTRTGAMYASLVEACLSAAEGEGADKDDLIRKAVMTAEDFVNSEAKDIDHRPTAKTALEKVEAVLMERGEQEQASGLQKYLATL